MKKFKIIILSLLTLALLITNISATQIITNPQNNKNIITSNSSTWIKTINVNEWDKGWDIKQTSDDGYIVLGNTHKYDENLEALDDDLFLIKIDSYGRVQWKEIYGNTHDNYGSSILVKPNGNFVIIGWGLNFVEPSEPVTYTHIIEIDSQGNQLWENKIAGTLGYYGEIANDGGYIIAGGFSGMTLLKTYENGTKQWMKKYDYYSGSHVVANAYCVEQTNDGGYILVGETGTKDEDNEYNLWIIKTNSQGEKEWDKTFGGKNTDLGFYIDQNTNDEFIITGYTYSYGNGQADLWLIKTDSDGNEIWNKTYGGGSTDYGTSLKITEDNGIIITGVTRSYGKENLEDVWLIKTDSDGNKIWDKTYGNEDTDYGNQVYQTNDGGYIIVGSTVNIKVIPMNLWDIYLIKTNENGESKPKDDTPKTKFIDYLFNLPIIKKIFTNFLKIKFQIDQGFQKFYSK